jgi:hypothetical protein
LEVDVADNSGIIKVAAIGVAAYVAYTQGWLSFLGIGTAATTAATSVPVTTGTVATTLTPAVPVSIATTPAAPTLAALQAATILAAAAPTAGLGVDQWGYYLNQVLGPLGYVAPDPLPIFSAAIPTFDRSQLVPTAQYWSIMGPALNKVGFSGLGMYWRTA